MVKSIIKRIIVGVGIALALMFIKGNLMLSVQALSVQNATPSSMYMIDTNGTSTNMNMTTDTTAGLNTTLYGRKFTSAVNRHYFYWNFDNNISSGLDVSQPLDIHFILHTQLTSQYNDPYRVFIIDHNHNTYTCNTQASSNYHNTNANAQVITGTYTNVNCSNIAFSSPTFKVYLMDTFGTTANGYVGISKLTLYPHSSNQAVVDAIDDNTQATQDVNNTLNDDSDADTQGLFSDLSFDYSNTPVSDLITMPITFLQRLNNNFNANCFPITLGRLYGHTITLPCLNIEGRMGQPLSTYADYAMCLFMAFNIAMMCVTIWNNLTSLKDDFDNMYEPRHAYNGKHSGGDS